MTAHNAQPALAEPVSMSQPEQTTNGLAHNAWLGNRLTAPNGDGAKPLALSDGGPLPCAAGTFATIAEILHNAAQEGVGKTISFPLPNGQALVWSYPDLLTAAQRICAGLQQQGLQPQDKVIFQLEKNYDVLPAFWGCMLGGFVPMVMDVPIAYEPANRAFEHLCRMGELLDAPLILTDSTLVAGVEQVQQSVPTAGVRLAQIETLRSCAPATVYHPGWLDDVAFLCFTSGSTGIPKCIQLTHRCVITRNDGTNLLNDHRADDVNLNWLPFDHIGSITEHIRSMQLCCSLVYVHKEEILSNPLNMLTIISHYRVTHTWGPNFIYALIHDALKEQTAAANGHFSWDLSSVRFLISGGEPASFKMMAAFLERTARFGFPATGFRPSYGMAELSAGITYYAPTPAAPIGFYWIAQAPLNGEPVQFGTPGQAGASPVASLGKPIPGTQIRVVDPQDRLLPEATVGRVQIKGNPIALGYYKNPTLNKTIFLDNGWFETDDLGFLSQGNLVLTGRAKEMLIINGANYYSREIEDMVEEVAGVEVAYTAACAVKDGKSEAEQLAIFFHPRGQDEASTASTAGDALQALIKTIRQTVVSRAHLNPAYLIPLPKAAIPKTPIGKIKRAELSQRFQQGEFAAYIVEKERTLVAPRTALEASIAEIWQEVLKLPTGVHDNFFELGGDSIKAVMVMNKLQEKLNGILHPVALFDAPTIAELSVYLQENYPLLFQETVTSTPATSTPLTDAQIEQMRHYLAQVLCGETVSIDQAGPKNKKAIFILAPARSGSTLLRVILAGNPQLFSPPELYLLAFERLQERKAKFSGRLGFLREGVVRALMAIKDCTNAEAEQWMALLEAQDLRVKEFYALLQSWLGERILVDKTPPYAFQPTILQRMEAEFDDALYIHLVRHPAAMIHSFAETRVDLAVDVHGHENSTAALSTQQKGELWWQISHHNILNFLATVPAQRQCRVKFEELVTEPARVIQQVCDFLGVAFHPAMLAPQQEQSQRMTDGVHQLAKLAGDPKFHTHQGITASAADHWQSVGQADALSEQTWQIARAFGYASGYAGKTSTKTVSLADFQVEPDLENRLLPFPLTDIQQAYWAGRNRAFELGGRSVHSYTEVEAVDLDVHRLNHAWQRMIERHEMLRTVILPDGSQQILPTIPTYTMVLTDFCALAPAAQATALNAIRAQMSHQVLSCEEWPLFEIRLSRLAQNRYRIHFSFDAILFDARSKYILFSEFSQFYQQPALILKPFELSFRDYVLRAEAIRDSALFDQARDYWLQQIPTLPGPPELPLALNPVLLEQPKFIQKNHYFAKAAWGQLKALAAQAQITPSCLLLTVFSDIIRVWNKLDSFTLNITAYNRLPLHAEVNDIIGDFTSLILMEIDPPGDQTFIVRARNLQKRLLNHLKHNAFSGVQVMRAMTKQRENKPGAQMPVVFTSVLGDEIQDTSQKPLDWLGDVIYNVTQTPQIWFDHIVFEEGGGLLCRWNIVEDLFPAGLMDDLFATYIAYLTRLTSAESAWRARWPETASQLIPADQLAQRRVVNATAAPISPGLLHAPFVAQVKLRPTQPAVIATDRTLTYQELSDRANQIGHRLRDLGVQPNQLVAVVMEKGWEQVAAVLGILAAGAAYLPIDPALPAERLHYLLEYGQVKIVLTQRALKDLLAWPPALHCLCVDDETFADQPTTALAAQQGVDDLAYVIFTSGSTGLPKGVMIDHRGALNTLLDLNSRFQVTATDRVLALSSLTFDLSVYDIFGLLAVGGTIVMPRSADVREPAQWARLVREQGVTIWNTVPAFMGLLLDYAEGRADVQLAALRLVMLSGDWIPLPLPDRIHQHWPQAQLFSLGGATEASIWSILYPIESVDPAWKSIPYGKPMLNQSFHVLNSALEPCPLWVPGQLYIGGIGLAKGYWRDEEKTDKSFITHPRTAGTHGERLYRTGDLGRYLPDGNIEFLGREDFQVKIQGFRVELGEIEAALLQHPAVKQVVVEAKGARHAEKQLVAYLVVEVNIPALTETMQRFLKQKLPAYMVPSVYVPSAELPLTANGKVDRKALPPPPTPQPTLPDDTRPAAAHATLLAKISAVVSAILDSTALEPHTDLFHLGATSIHMMRIANQLEKVIGFRPAIDEFYANPSVLGLAALYAAAQGTSTRNLASHAPDPRHLSPAFLQQFDFIGDPSARQHFKAGEPGLRKLDGPFVQLAAADPAALQRLAATRRSQRHFAAQAITLRQFGEFLACLQQIKLADKPKYLYASAGGLYPVQSYLYIKPGWVAGIAGGVYYYHPVEHRLCALAEQVEVDEQIYNRLINRPIFQTAAFGLFLIAQMEAIAPLYREQSLHFAVLEAGLMAQLLEMHAPAVGLGLCQIGEVDFARIRPLFGLAETHLLVHSLLGGIPAPEPEERRLSIEAADYGLVEHDNSAQEREEEEF